MQNLNVQGQCQTVNPGSPTIEIPLPQLPSTGAWSVDGTILAFNTGAPAAADNASVAFTLFISGNSVGGAALRNDGGGPSPYTTLPANGGLGVALSVAIGSGPGLTQTLYLTLNDGVSPSTVAWGWDLDVNFLTQP